MSFLLARTRKIAIMQHIYGRLTATLQKKKGGLRQLLRSIQDSTPMIFLQEVYKKPRSMGTVCPSSRHLAKRMAQSLPEGKGLVVELGAGTGEVTKEISKTLNDQSRLWAVEQSPALAALLAKRIPQTTVIEGDARELSKIIPHNHPVDAIVSCLPLRSFTASDVKAITKQWAAVLAPHGVVVQFTYVPWKAHMLHKYGFKEETSSMVWKNFPPARVQVLKKIN